MGLNSDEPINSWAWQQSAFLSISFSGITDVCCVLLQGLAAWLYATISVPGNELTYKIRKVGDCMMSATDQKTTYGQEYHVLYYIRINSLSIWLIPIIPFSSSTLCWAIPFPNPHPFQNYIEACSSLILDACEKSVATPAAKYIPWVISTVGFLPYLPSKV